MNTIGDRIKNIRQTAHMTQAQFACATGISQTHVSKIESGVENPSLTLIMLISCKFGISMTYIQDNNEFNTVGEIIKKIRLEAGQTQTAFASNLGITPSYVSKIEHGLEDPSVTLIKLVSLTYGYEEKYIKGFEVRKNS